MSISPNLDDAISAVSALNLRQDTYNSDARADALERLLFETQERDTPEEVRMAAAALMNAASSVDKEIVAAAMIASGGSVVRDLYIAVAAIAIAIAEFDATVACLLAAARKAQER